MSKLKNMILALPFAVAACGNPGGAWGPQRENSPAQEVFGSVLGCEEGDRVCTAQRGREAINTATYITGLFR